MPKKKFPMIFFVMVSTWGLPGRSDPHRVHHDDVLLAILHAKRHKEAIRTNKWIGAGPPWPQGSGPGGQNSFYWPFRVWRNRGVVWGTRSSGGGSGTPPPEHTKGLLALLARNARKIFGEISSSNLWKIGLKYPILKNFKKNQKPCIFQDNTKQKKNTKMLPLYTPPGEVPDFFWSSAKRRRKIWPRKRKEVGGGSPGGPPPWSSGGGVRRPPPSWT